MNKFKIANIGMTLIGVSLGTPLFAHSDEIICGTTYVVERADSLSNISEWAYGTSRRVEEIYAANADQIGPDRSALIVGMELNIPCIEGEELVASAPDTEADTAQAEADAAAELAVAEATAAAEVAAEALTAAQAAATQAAEALAAAETEVAAKAAEVEAAAAAEVSAAAEEIAAEDTGTEASAISDAESAEDLMAMSSELLTIEGFDADKVMALIGTLDLPAAEKTKLSDAVVAAEDRPVLLRAVLTGISNQIGR